MKASIAAFAATVLGAIATTGIADASPITTTAYVGSVSEIGAGSGGEYAQIQMWTGVGNTGTYVGVYNIFPSQFSSYAETLTRLQYAMNGHHKVYLYAADGFTVSQIIYF